MNAMRAALAPIPAEPWDALTAERRIDHAPTPAGAARREPPRGARDHARIARADARNIAGRRADAPTRLLAYSPTHRRPTKSRSISLLPPADPAIGPAIRARK
ncbi:hypothetical protein [Burkholderia multivorans]|uniref:hypothetical protein n=1 Tax=Burkholderia multivorans TaxID=87883 RepID=UPI001E576D01|nr:hypothetical protein [Burkholderia multivorans]MCA8142252.1 hypothetical protein [Burkholderia multivorans]MCO1363206.1 hypothetical protein [Burkholderia multivorans]MCO1379752.1 hypothetical protein [Burkholderia multivorans]UQP23330.1 hypothetical protein L0Y98_20965 [Burkholderia multivorans]UQP90564.1 hypothetical protein L0Y91_17220 [Burkholderia multivorans]